MRDDEWRLWLQSNLLDYPNSGNPKNAIFCPYKWAHWSPCFFWGGGGVHLIEPRDFSFWGINFLKCLSFPIDFWWKWNVFWIIFWQQGWRSVQRMSTSVKGTILPSSRVEVADKKKFSFRSIFKPSFTVLDKPFTQHKYLYKCQYIIQAFACSVGIE